LLKDWVRLNADLSSLPQEAVMQIMEAEAKGQRRVSFLLRLHSRFNRLRAIRERRTISSGVLPWK
jgi:hypothetical protein